MLVKDCTTDIHLQATDMFFSRDPIFIFEYFQDVNGHIKAMLSLSF